MNSAFDMHLPKEDIPIQSDLFSIDFSTFLEESVTNGNSSTSDYPMCPECQSQGRESQLGLYQINFSEAISMCPHPSCPYPMKENNLLESFVIKQDASTIDTKQNPLQQKLKKPRKKQLDSYEEFFKDFDINSLLIDDTAHLGGQLQAQVASIAHDINGNPHDIHPKSGNTKETNANSAKEKAESNSTTDPIDSDSKEESAFEFENNEQFDETMTVESPPEKKAIAENPDISDDIKDTEEEITFNFSKEERSNDVTNIEIDKHSDQTEVISNHTAEKSVLTTKNLLTESATSPAENIAQNSNPDQEENSDTVQVQMPMIDDDVFDEDTQENIIGSLALPPRNQEIIQWSNESNSCWLDAILICLVNSVNVRAILNVEKNDPLCLLRRVCVEYDKCQENSEKPTNNCSNKISKITARLAKVRRDIVTKLNKKMKLSLGKFQSLLEMFPMILKICPEVEKYFKIHTLWHFRCESCGHERARRSVEHIVSFPHTSPDFHPLNASFERACFNCSKNTGNIEITMERLPPCLIFHFQNGLPHSNFKVLDFGLQGALYSVIAVVQYVIEPVKHFIAWIRNPKTNRWLCCNDLKEPVCRWQQKQPRIPPSEVHMVYWERQSVHDPRTADKSCFSTVLNNEANSIADEIPVELFYAYENDETVVLSEDKVMHNMNAMKTLDDPMQKKANHSLVVDVDKTAEKNNETLITSDTNHTQASVMNGSVHLPSTTIIPQNSFITSNALPSNAISVIPATNGGQTIQVVAPSNTCNIVILMSDNKNQPIVYNSQQVTMQSPPATQSFLRDKRFHSNKRQINTMPSDFSSYKPKRHFKLSGYAENKSLIKKYKFSPLRVTTKKNSQSKPVAQSKQTAEKSDSEKGSEVSEMSDLLPDFDVRSHSSGDSHNSAPPVLKRAVITPPLPDIRATSPATSLNGFDGSYIPRGKNSNAIFSQNSAKDSGRKESDQASAELFFLNDFLS